MGRILEQKIDRWDGGMVNDPRDTRENTAKVVTNFDILTDSHRMIPYRDSVDGDDGSSTSKKQNFCIATNGLYAYGRKSDTETAEILYKSLTITGATDLVGATWAYTSNYQSSDSGTLNYNLFVYYKKTNRIYGARKSRYIWAYDPSGTVAWADTSKDLADYSDVFSTSFTHIAQGLVHSKDDILYVGVDNFIIKNNNGTWTAGTAPALTLPKHLYITSLCEAGNNLAIACAPVSGVGNSVVYLWDRDSSLTTLSESIDWGEGLIKVLEEVDGYLVGISLVGGVGGVTGILFNDRVIFRYLSGNKAIKFSEFKGDYSTQLPIAKQKIGGRLYFMMSINLHGATREGVWSIGRNPSGGFAIVHERTPNNDTALTSGTLNNFFIVGDFMFISYQD